MSGEQFPLPMGNLPVSFEVQQMPSFPPELQVALQKARDASGGRYMIAVYTEDENKVVTQNLTFGPAWDKNRLYLTAHELFVAEHHKIDAARLSAIQRPAESSVSQSIPPGAVPRDY